MIFDWIIQREPVSKGWSVDRKYRVTTAEGEQYLLRISPETRLEAVKKCYERMRQVEALGVPMCRALEYGTCPEGVYVIHSWVEGEDAEAVIPRLSPERQYAYGLNAGRVLKQIHSLPAPEDAPGWEVRYGSKIDRKLVMYRNSPLKYDHDECLLTFIARNRRLIAERGQCYQHGDYHIGNMMIADSGQLTIIDFEKEDFGDPWEEFNRIVWSAQAAPDFASGMVDGYFDGAVPMEFWKLLALYISVNTLSSLPWAIPFGEEEITTMRAQQAQVLIWYDHMKTPVPGWYRKSG